MNGRTFSPNLWSEKKATTTTPQHLEWSFNALLRHAGHLGHVCIAFGCSQQKQNALLLQEQLMSMQRKVEMAEKRCQAFAELQVEHEVRSGAWAFLGGDGVLLHGAKMKKAKPLVRWTTAGAPSRGWPVTDRGGGASLLPLMPYN